MHAYAMIKEPLVLIWDDTCAFCARSVRVIQQLDWFHCVRCVGASQVGTLPPHWVQGYRAEESERGLWCRPLSQKSHSCVGFKAVRRLGWVLPLTWPVFWLGYIPGLSALGEVIYAWIAANRHRWGCQSDQCPIN